MEKLRHSTTPQKVLLGPFVSSTDLSVLTALTIQNTDIKISKHNNYPVSKNSGGATHIANGIYETTLDATDTNITGTGQINVQMPGAMPVKVWFEVLTQARYDQEVSNIPYSTFNPSAQSVTVGVNNDKTGYTLTDTPLTPTDFNNAIPANFKDLAITASTGRVTVGTNVDKAGYTLTDMNVNVVNVAGAAVSSINDFKSNPLTQGQTEAAVATALTAYNAAKIGSAMTLTSGERDAVAVEVEAHLLDEGDSQPLIDAIVQAIGNTNVDELVLVAAIRSELERAGGNLNTLLTRLTEDRAGFLDKLNVTGTLANTNNADTFKADVSGLLTTVQFTNSLPANFDTLVIDVNGEVIASNMVDDPPTIGDFQTAVEDGLTAYDAPNRTDISNIPGGGGGSGASAAQIWSYFPRTLTPPDDALNPSITAHRHAGTIYQGFDYTTGGHTELTLIEQAPSQWDKDIIDIGGLKLHLRNVQTGHSVTVDATSTYNSTAQIHTLKAELDSTEIPTKTGLYKGFFYASSSGTGSPTDYFLITTFSVNVEQGISNC